MVDLAVTNSILKGMGIVWLEDKMGKTGLKIMQLWMKCCDMIWSDMKYTLGMRGWLIADALNKGDLMMLLHRLGPMGTMGTWLNDGHSWRKLTYGTRIIKRRWTSKYKCHFITKFNFERWRSNPSSKNGLWVKCQIIKWRGATHLNA